MRTNWTCCVSLVRQEGSEVFSPKSFVARSPEEEHKLLAQLWEEVRHVSQSARWITFNGKDFDVPFLQMRSLACGASPTESGLNDTYPYSHTPHADLMKVWPKSHYTLGQLCSHLGIASPKGEVEGGEVASLVRAGKISEIATYCEGDAKATLQCWHAMGPLLDALG